MKSLYFICGLCLLIVMLQISALAQENNAQLSLLGEVQSVEIVKDNYGWSQIKVNLQMELVNTGTKPIILLREGPVFPGAVIAKVSEDPKKPNILATSYGGESNDISSKWSILRQKLDQPSPPSDLTKILLPTESWTLETTARLSVPTDSKVDISYGKKESLKVIKNLSPVSLRVICEVWSWNIEELDDEREKLKFGHKLKERWKNFGSLWLDEIYSEPILLNLNSAVAKTERNK